MSPRKQSRKGASLIELLVAVVVVSILMALAFGVFGSTSKRGRDAQCLANLKQLGAGALLYAYEHNGRLPDNANATYYWHWVLGNYLSLEMYDPKNILKCPSGSPDEIWFHKKAGAHYSMNSFLDDTSSTSGGKTTVTPAPVLLQIKRPAIVGLYMDGYANVYHANYKAGNGVDTTNRLRLRHGSGKQINVVYLDGHANSVTPIETKDGFIEQIWPSEAFK